MSEVWKPIKGYEGIYEVSSYGRVRSLEHSISLRNQHGEYVRKLSERIIKQKRNRKDGYFNVTLCKRAEHSTAYVHRLVAQAFIPNPDNLPQVNHKDEDKTNNRVDNLEWCSAQYNTNYGTGHERMTEPRRVKVAMVDEQGNIIRKFESIKEASEQTGEARLTIIRQCKRESTLGHVLKYYRWKFI